MLKTMVFKEIEKEKELKNVFLPEKSIVFRVFRWFALKEVHYKDVVHKIMDTTKKNEPPVDKPTEVVKSCLLGALVDATNQEKKFVLTLEEFQKISQHGEDVKDKQEILAEYNQGLERFKEFMLGDFTRTIKDCDMHDNLRKIWAYCYKQLLERGFQPDPTNTSITAELQILIPLLNLFVKGFLMVLVQDPVKYAGKEVYLAHCAKDANDDSVRLNCKGLECFLESMMQDDGSGDVTVYNNSRLLASVAKSLKPDLLKYLKDQATVEDDTDTMLVIDVYVAHFSRMSKVVSVPTSILLKTSNILNREQAKIQLHSNDPVGIICSRIGMWEPDMIQSAEKDDMLHNFQMNTRFLFNQKDRSPDTPALVIDRTSHCPVPFKLSSTQDKQSGDGSIVNRYVVKTTSADQKAKMELENLLREMDVVEASDFATLKQEIDKMLKVATSKSPPNYGLAHKFTDGLHRIDELERLECSPEQLLEAIGSALTQRSNHRLYLEQVQVGTTKIKEAKSEYMSEIEEAKNYLNRALKVSMSLKLPTEIVKASREHGATLEYDKIAQRIQSLDPFGRQPALLSKCSYSPVAEVSMSKLKKTGVVEGALGNLKNVEHQMQLTFMHTADGGVEVMCSVHAKGVTSTVKHIKISGDMLLALRRADAADKINLPEEDEKNCIVFNSLGLAGLLTKLATGL